MISKQPEISTVAIQSRYNASIQNYTRYVCAWTESPYLLYTLINLIMFRKSLRTAITMSPTRTWRWSTNTTRASNRTKGRYSCDWDGGMDDCGRGIHPGSMHGNHPSLWPVKYQTWQLNDGLKDQTLKIPGWCLWLSSKPVPTSLLSTKIY